MRHRTIHEKCLLIDQFVDFYMKAKKRKRFPHKEVGQVIKLLFPNSRNIGRGAFKTVHQISSRKRDLALKVSQERSIDRDLEAYNKLPSGIRNRYFAKIYWKTRYCLLQKYGKKVRVPPREIELLKKKVAPHGLTDVREANVRKVDGKFKIVDAIAE